MFFLKTSIPYLLKASYLSLCLLTVYPGTVSSQSVQPIKAKVHKDFKKTRDNLVEIIEAVQNKYNIPGLSLAVTRGNETLWLESFGYSDVKKSLPAKPETLFRAGSLAKPLTAIAIMQLADEGKIDIDQPVTAYLPEFKIKSRHDHVITIRDILCHHSGLPTDLNKGKWSNEDFKKVVTQLAQEFTTYEPNKVFSYSNIGYTILGHIIERVQHLSYSEYIHKNIFQKLNMDNSFLGHLPNASTSHSKGYKKGQQKQLLPIRDVPAYGLMTSSSDLVKLMQNFLDHESMSRTRVLAPGTVEEMLEPQNIDVALDKNIINGLGWFIEHDPSDKDNIFIRHGGTTLYFSSEMILSSQDNIGVTVLSNAGDSRVIVSQLAMEILKNFRKHNGKQANSALSVESAKHRPAIITESEVIGNYVTDVGVLRIQQEGDRLCASIAEKTFDLESQADGWITLKPESHQDVPPALKPLTQMQYQTQIIDDTEVIVAKYNKKEMILGQKMPTIEIPESWRQRVGKYEVENQDPAFPITDTELLIDKGILYMKYRMPLLADLPIQSPLNPISEAEAIVMGLGRNRGDTVWVSKTGDKEFVHYSGYRGSKTVN